MNRDTQVHKKKEGKGEVSLLYFFTSDLNFSMSSHPAEKRGNLYFPINNITNSSSSSNSSSVSRSVVSNSAIPQTVACQAPLSLGFSRQEYWSVQFPPEDLSYPRIEPGSPALQADSLPSAPPGKTK